MRHDLYDTVTASIITALEAGVRPWAPLWSGGERLTRPLRANGQAYKGVNVLLLWSAAMAKGYTSASWLTFKQALELGANVRKGEKSTAIVFVGAMERERVNAATGAPEAVKVPFLKSYNVFNACQCDGLPDRFTPAPVETMIDEMQRLQAAEAFFANVGANVTEGGAQAFYRPATDSIHLPPFVTFKAPASFYSVQAHETVHWTAHKSRLDRTFTGSTRFGGEGYAMEELVAELGAAFFCADLGLVNETRDDHAAYLDNWLKALKADNRAIFTAAAAAQRACDFLHAFQPEAVTAAADELQDA